PQCVPDLLGTHALSALRDQHLEELHRPTGSLAGELDRRRTALDLRAAEERKTELPRPLTNSQGRDARHESVRLDHRLGEIALDAVRERRRAELGRRVIA